MSQAFVTLNPRSIKLCSREVRLVLQPEYSASEGHKQQASPAGLKYTQVKVWSNKLKGHTAFFFNFLLNNKICVFLNTTSQRQADMSSLSLPFSFFSFTSVAARDQNEVRLIDFVLSGKPIMNKTMASDSKLGRWRWLGINSGF